MTTKPKSKLFNICAPIALIILLVIVWQIACTAFDISFHVLPKPAEVGRALLENFPRTIFPDMMASVKVMLAGYCIAIPLGFAIAAFSSQFNLAVKSIMPVLIILMLTPMATLVPIFKLFLGVDPTLKIIIVVLQCTPVIAVNSLSGFIYVPQAKKDLMRALGCRKWESFFRVTVPGAMPQIFTGLKLGCILCTIAAMSADISVGQGGLGYRIQVASSLSATDLAYAAIVIAAILGVVLYMAVSLVETRVITWK
ncbi:MAG: ABC transporter permease subunit [Clostridiales Family XIII bacterium]|jgi:ABC-type nitrate/sulfonate/bicarbonate transport system permease component|nr:ABC transporter permease subunit [Clostridiales Family XIII bacterium]